ncbi:MAG: hypothetical protein R3Y13_05055 [bacterium]
MSESKDVEVKQPKKKNNIKTYVLLLLLLLTITVLGVSFAYFMAMGDLSGGSDVSVELVERAQLDLSTSGDLSINATMTNFVQNGSNLSDTITGTAILTAGEVYSDVYNVYYEISDNEFIYTTGADETPELILHILDAEGYEVTSVEGLEYVTSGEVTGFDITTKSGTFEIAGDYVITTDGIDPTEQEWTFTLYFMNLETNQNDNAGKEFVSQAILQRDGEEIDLTDPNTLYTNVLLNSNESGTPYSTVSEAITAIEGKSTPDFNYNATTDEGMFAQEDSHGTSYYYRGAVTDNWVEFAGKYWRIIRVDGEGNTKLIYSGTDAPVDDSAVMTGAGTQIAKTSFQNSILTISDNELLSMSVEGAGYVYTDGELHGTTSDSYAKEILEDWYSVNLISYDAMLATTEYCIDRNSYTIAGSSGSYTWTPNDTTVTSNVQYFGASQRVAIAKEGTVDNTVTPSLKCTTESDKLNLKIGLISLDEASLAGGTYSNGTSSSKVSNTDFYLYTNQDYWTITPYLFLSYANVGYIDSAGYLDKDGVSSPVGYRPTVTLNSNVQITGGTGTGTDPYVIA